MVGQMDGVLKSNIKTNYESITENDIKWVYNKLVIITKKVKIVIDGNCSKYHNFIKYL